MINSEYLANITLTIVEPDLDLNAIYPKWRVNQIKMPGIKWFEHLEFNYKQEDPHRQYKFLNQKCEHDGEPNTDSQCPWHEDNHFVNWSRHSDHLTVRTNRKLTKYVNLWGKGEQVRIYADFKVEDPGTIANP